MNKSMKAFFLGYILFDVNGERYWLYSNANARSKEISGDVYFKGFNFWHFLVSFVRLPPLNTDWRGFFYRYGFRK